MLNWRRDLVYELRMSEKLSEIERIKTEILPIEKETLQVEKETEQIEKETQRLLRDNVTSRALLWRVD